MGFRENYIKSYPFVDEAEEPTSCLASGYSAAIPIPPAQQAPSDPATYGVSTRSAYTGYCILRSLPEGWQHSVISCKFLVSNVEWIRALLVSLLIIRPLESIGQLGC